MMVWATNMDMRDTFPPTATVAALLVVGWIVGANQQRFVAWLGYYFPQIIQMGEPTISSNDLVSAAEYIIQCSIRGNPGGSCLIANVDQQGNPRVRPINPIKVNLRDPHQPYVVFFTNKKSRKYAQLKKNSRVELCYFDPKGIGSVRLAGEVQEQTVQESQAYWKWRLEWYLPEGPQGDRFTTFKILPERVELISLRLGLPSVEREDWHPYTMIWKGGQWVNEEYPIKGIKCS